MRNCYVYDNGKTAAFRRLLSKHAWINVLIVKELGKIVQRNLKGHLNALSGIMQHFPCFYLTYNSSLILLDSLVSKYNENI